MTLNKRIKQDGEEFEVKFDSQTGVGTVTDESGTSVTISYEPGDRPYNVRTSGGWGQWVNTLESAIDYAVQLNRESREFLSRDEYNEKWQDYLKSEC